MKKIFLLFFTVFVLAASVFADSSKIAVVDLEKVFREYYKSKIAEDLISRQAGVYRNYLERLANELKSAKAKAENARAEALNLGLSAADRTKAEQAAAQAFRTVSEKQAEIALYRSGREKDMQKLEESKRKEIMDDIKAELKKRAAAGGYTYVFDSSGKTTNNMGAILIYPAAHDITNEVINSLNRRASAKK